MAKKNLKVKDIESLENTSMAALGAQNAVGTAIQADSSLLICSVCCVGSVCSIGGSGCCTGVTCVFVSCVVTTQNETTN